MLSARPERRQLFLLLCSRSSALRRGFGEPCSWPSVAQIHSIPTDPAQAKPSQLAKKLHSLPFPACPVSALPHSTLDYCAPHHHHTHHTTPHHVLRRQASCSSTCLFTTFDSPQLLSNTQHCSIFETWPPTARSGSLACLLYTPEFVAISLHYRHPIVDPSQRTPTHLYASSLHSLHCLRQSLLPLGVCHED